jgi:hypothetical protein
MVAKAKLTVNLQVAKEFPKFIKRFRQEIVENGLDKPISESLIKLKKELKNLVNNKTTAPSATKNPLNPKQPNSPIAVKPLMSKSQEDILQYLTGADLKNHSPQKNHNVDNGSKIVEAQPSRNRSTADRVDVRIAINPYESVQEHYNRALSIFSESVFALPNERGETEFFLNNGEDLTSDTKIDCSTFTGAGNTEPKKGMSPERRFELDKKNKGYATWTLKQDFVRKMRQGQTKFLNINPVIKSIQEGDPEEAIRYLRSFKASNLVNEIIQKVTNIAEDVDLPQELQAYTHIVKLIDTLRISKRISKTIVTYSLVSTVNTADGPETKKFLDQMHTALVLWSSSNADKWFKDLVATTTKLIKNFEAGK